MSARIVSSTSSPLDLCYEVFYFLVLVGNYISEEIVVSDNLYEESMWVWHELTNMRKVDMDGGGTISCWCISWISSSSLFLWYVGVEGQA